MSDTEQPTQTKKPSVGAIGFVIAFLILTAIGYILSDSQQPNPQPYGIIMGIMWGSALASFFAVWMLYYAYYILPGSSLTQWNSGLRLLFRYYIRQPIIYISHLLSKSRLRKKERTRRSDKEKETPKPAYEYSFAQLGAGVVPTHIALALDNTSKKQTWKSLTTELYKIQHGKSIDFSRAVGPGIVILQGNYVRKTETITHRIDLRPHIRIAPVKVVTRDGINIETSAIVIFHVNRAKTDNNTPNDQDNDEKHYILYPYDTEDIRRLRYDYKDNEWHTHIAPRAALLLADELSSLALDELHDAEGATLLRIRETVRNKLDEQMNPTTTDDDGTTEKKNSGITIVMVNLFSIEEPKKIQQRRFKLWKIGIKEKIEVLKLEQQADSARAIQAMQAEVQRKVINNVISSIQSMYDAQNITQSEIITLRMVTALESAMQNADLTAMSPQMLTHWVIDTIKQMNLMLEDGEIT